MMSPWKVTTAFFLILALLLRAGAQAVRSQTEIAVIPDEPVYTFNEQVHFSAQIRADQPIKEALLLIQSGGETAQVRVIQAEIGEDRKTRATLDLKESPLRAFSRVEYWYQIVSEAGEVYIGPHFSFEYSDNRFEWQTISGTPFRIFWYEGDLAFAQEVLNVALAAVPHIREILEVYLPDPLRIYVYRNAGEMQAALSGASENWVAGHADPDLGVILVSLPAGPEQRLEMERQIPHEMMHVALYYTDANAYQHLPVWYNEGLASLAELYPSPEYQAILEEAFHADGLIPMGDLCLSFPTESSARLLAYAQAASFSRYLFTQYGSPGLNRLQAAFASGFECQVAAERALEIKFNDLERNWIQNTFSPNAMAGLWREIAPWLIILAVILIGPIIMILNNTLKRPRRQEI